MVVSRVRGSITSLESPWPTALSLAGYCAALAALVTVQAAYRAQRKPMQDYRGEITRQIPWVSVADASRGPDCRTLDIVFTDGGKAYRATAGQASCEGRDGINPADFKPGKIVSVRGNSVSRERNGIYTITREGAFGVPWPDVKAGEGEQNDR